MDDKEYQDFKEKLDNYVPLIPEIVIDHYMEKCGVSSIDENVKKTISLMSHKFMTDVIIGAFQHHKIHVKGAQKDKRFGREKKTTLQIMDLQKALEDMGIDISRPYYYI